MKQNNSRPKIGLALSGGSALGIAHIGVIKALRENKIPIDFVAGTSAGAIAAAGIAFDLPIEKMIEMSKRMNWSEISEFGHSRFGLNSNRPMAEILVETMGDVKIEDSKIPLAIVATDIDSGKEVVFKKGRMAEAIMASACLPGLFVPVKIHGERLVDGGLVENLPLSPLFKMGAEVRIGVNLAKWRKFRKVHNALEVVANSYGILTMPQQAFARQAEILIEPHLEEFTHSDFEKIEELMKKGYDAAGLMMPEIKKHLGVGNLNAKGLFEKVSRLIQKLGD